MFLTFEISKLQVRYDDIGNAQELIYNMAGKFM